MKTNLFLEIELEVDYDFCPAERMTRHYPGSPAQVEINTILINDIELPPPIFNTIMADFGDVIEEWCWDDVRNSEAERAICEAEHRREWMEDR